MKKPNLTKEEIDQLTHKIIGCAKEVHNKMGNGFQEVIYQRTLAIEFGFKYVDYFDIVRDLIEYYRLIFIRWVQSFDRWGLFNPSGVGPLDKDPDDDILNDDFRDFD